MDGKTVNLLSTALKIALGILLVLTSTVARTNAAPPTPLTIDVVLSMTGAGAALGKDESLAFAIFEKTSNAKGGINGRPVHFEIHDDATNPQVAVQLASAILARAPVVFMGSSLAASCAAMAALVPQGPVQFCLSPAFEPKNGAYTFGAGGSVGYLLPASFNYIRDSGYTRVASIATSDASGISGERSMDDAIALPENRNIKLVAREHFAVGDISVAAQIARIAASGAQLVFAFTTGSALGTALHGLNDAGMNLPVFATTSAMNVQQLASYASFIPKELLFASNVFIAPARGGILRPVQQEFGEAFKAAGTPPSPLHSYSWDAALIVVSGLRRLGTNATAAQLRAYIEQLHDFPGVNGIYDFRIGDQHGLTASSVVVSRWDPKMAYWIPVSDGGGVPLR
jgi:branched-chain amino acid transport system substrate-binding protein